MQMVRVLVAAVILWSVLMSLAQQDDQIVSKDFPANITCQRNRAQRNIERQQALAIGGSENLYRACYAYEIDSGGCEINAASLIVDRLLSFPHQNSTLIIVDSPFTREGVYPPNTICFFVIGNRRAGFIYQYYEAIEQDLEGSLEIVTTQMDTTVTTNVDSGLCQDFFELRMKSQIDPREALVTCGNESDPRIRLGVEVAQALTLIFRSDGNLKQNRGVNLTIIEINTTAANMYSSNDGASRRKRSNIVAPKGPQGLHGDIGLPGTPGRPGKSGEDGIDGSMGRKGERGIKGVRGPEGPPGTIEGNQGPTGFKGPRGPNGLPCDCSSLKHCTPGKQGEKGPPGPHGYRGDPGKKGPRGLPGQSGPRGIPGPKGRKGSRGSRGFNGLNGAPGDQGPPGRRGPPGSVGPPGLGGCPVPDHEMTRRALEMGYITEITKELYYGSSDKQYKKSVRRFHNHLVNQIMEHKKEFKKVVSSHQTASKVKSGVINQNRFTRQTKSSDELRQSSFECGGVPVLPGAKGEDGVRGPPGLTGQNGIPGRPGINGAYGMAGDPGEPGMEGSSGSPGSKGYPGEKGIYGQTGEPGLPGQCSCFKYQKHVYRYESSTHHTPSEGRMSSPKTRSFYYPDGYGIKVQRGDIGSRGPKGPPGHRGNAGSPGLPGVKGPMGYRGANGVTGRTGPSGLPGPKGYTGWRGLPGNAGPPGLPGPSGCVCNNLILYLDRYGFLVDPANITEDIKDEFDRVEVNITCIRMEGSPIIGQKGEQGSPGYPGSRGYPGNPGTDGRDGLTGQKGVKGERGYIGQKGFQGRRGPPGKPGLPGSPGSQGYPGRYGKCLLNPEDQSYYSKLVPTTCPKGCQNGHKGLRGDDGPTGPRGSPGYPGPLGYAGPRGPRGIAGLPGDPGDEGFAGSPGYRGPRGHRGLPGAPGPAGPQGPPGPSDNCPEFDGIDFDVLYSPTPQEMTNIEYLFATADVNLAMSQTGATFPFLRELADFVVNGGRFPQRPAICVEITNTTVGKDLITVEFRGTEPFTCQLDRQSSVPCSSPITYSRAKLLGGLHKVTITGGNNTCMETTNFTIPLELNISFPIVDCDTVTITFSSNGRTQCQLDQRYITYCKSPYHQSGLRSGKHTVTIRTTDGRGGYKQKTVTFTIILDKPQWSGWNEWSVCTRSCGTGRSLRRRNCVQAECPDPNYRRCDGNSYEERKCNKQCCPEKPQLSSWTYWSACSKSCGGGIKYRRRKCIPSSCPYSDPKYNKCYGSKYEEKKCNENCCPEKPHWGEWKDWSACSRSCGGGVSYRKRRCYQSKCPHPYYKTCHGNDYEHKRCNEQCCPEKPYWGSWGQWSDCSKSCGGGIQYKRRKCFPSNCPYSDPKYNKCYGSEYEERKCNDKCCPEKPHWGEWKDWSACSRSCGGGVTIRRRHCYQSKCPHPYYKTCHGNDYEHKRCNEQCCPEKPYWGYWGRWSVCSKTCGGGISFRKRQCYQSKCPHPIYKKCTGSDYEEIKCNDRCCPAPIKFIGKPQVSYHSVKVSYTSSLPTQCRLDWGSFEYCKSSYQQSNLKPGRHTLVVRNTGKTGCQEQNSVYFYIADYQPYSLKIKVTGVRQAKNCVWISYTLTYSASTLCSFDNKEWKKCYSPLYSCGLKPGKHIASIKATDRNSQTATIDYTFTIY